MNIDIVPVEKSYRGVDRLLNSGHFNPDNEYEKTLELYDDYIRNTAADPAEDCEKLLNFFTHLRKTGVECELIAYDKLPINADFTFLGIDLVNENLESVLSDEKSAGEICAELNDCGLFSNGADAEKFLVENSHDEAGHKLFPYFVYSVLG